MQPVAELLEDAATLLRDGGGGGGGHLAMTFGPGVTRGGGRVAPVGRPDGGVQVVSDVRYLEVVERYRRRSVRAADRTHRRNLP